MPNFVQIEGYIGALAQHLHEIGRKHIWELSEPIFPKFNTHRSRLNSVRYAKFRAYRRIYRYFCAPFTLNRTKIYMGAISKFGPIFTKRSKHHFGPNSVPYAKFRENRRIYRDFGAPFTWKRAKLYIGAIFKSEPIFTKLSTHHSGPNSVLYA